MSRAEALMAKAGSRGLWAMGSVALYVAIALVPGLALGRDDGADGRFEKRTSSHFVLYQDVDIDETS
jgi:hypothetical protein